jgi:hypothetical protein
VYVGQRHALVARHIAYGQEVIYSGPLYDSMSIEGNKIWLTFKSSGSGLVRGVPPPDADGETLMTPSQLNGFGIAGEDHSFIWAKAEIDGNTIVISSETVKHPVVVRYDWGQTPMAISTTRRACLPRHSEPMTGRPRHTNYIARIEPKFTLAWGQLRSLRPCRAT